MYAENLILDYRAYGQVVEALVDYVPEFNGVFFFASIII
jgi:hypothetical protein